MTKTGKALWSLIMLALVIMPGRMSYAKTVEAEGPGLSVSEPELPEDFSQKVSKGRNKLARATAKLQIRAPREIVWKCLTDFPHYPQVFHRMKTCTVVKQEGNKIWVEGDLKPHMFVRKMHNRTVISLDDKPKRISWRLIDGNFKLVRGFWELEPLTSGSTCQATYILEVDPGPVIPRFLVSFVLRHVQKEIMASVKNWAEESARAPTITYKTLHSGGG